MRTAWRNQWVLRLNTCFEAKRGGAVRKIARPKWTLLSLLTIVFLFSPPLSSQTTENSSTSQPAAVEPDVTMPPLQKLAQASPEGLTRQQGDAILKELRSIRQLLQQQQANTSTKTRKRPTSAKITLADQPSLGQADAPVTMIEFTDYQCPYCKRFHDNTFPKLREKYINTGKLRYVMMDLPLRFHAQARPAANAAHCAAEQDQFWQMREILFKNSRALGQQALLGYAGDLSLDVAVFSKCLDAKLHDRKIQRDMQIARGAGFTGTPSFVIGRSVNGQIDGVALIGAKPLAEFESQIQRLLPKVETGG